MIKNTSKIILAVALSVGFAQAEMIKVTESIAISKPYTKK